MKVLFNQGKFGPLIRFLQGASEALGSLSSTAAGQSSTAAGASKMEAAVLLWGANRLSVTNWLVAALDKVEGQFRGVGLALLMERWVEAEAGILLQHRVCVVCSYAMQMQWSSSAWLQISVAAIILCQVLRGRMTIYNKCMVVRIY
jgi:hypothetical protein